MKAAVFTEEGAPLTIQDMPKPKCQKGELLVKVQACGVCRTDLHILDGDLPSPKFPRILGHEIVGIVEEDQTGRFSKGATVGIPWLGGACGSCEFCVSGKENLCDQGKYTGYHRDGGFAEYTTALADFVIPLPPGDPKLLAPLLCAGLIGYRSFVKASPEKTLGMYGFGVAAHLLTQLAVGLGKEVYAFTREGDEEGQAFAKSLGATWAGASTQTPPKLLDAVIHFAPVGELIPPSLKVLKKGGRCICGGIHMSDIPSFAYQDLWGEKSIASVANLTRQDGLDYFAHLVKINVHPTVTTYPIEKINEAIQAFRSGSLTGASVIMLE